MDLENSTRGKREDVFSESSSPDETLRENEVFEDNNSIGINSSVVNKDTSKENPSEKEETSKITEVNINKYENGEINFNSDAKVHLDERQSQNVTVTQNFLQFHSDELEKYFATGKIGRETKSEKKNDVKEAVPSIPPYLDPAQMIDRFAVVKWLSTLSSEDFLLAILATVYNQSEQSFFQEKYEKFKEHYLRDDAVVLHPYYILYPDKQEEKIPPPPIHLRSAIDVFGKGLEQRLNDVGAEIADIKLRLGGSTKIVRVVQIIDPRLYVTYWDIIRNSYSSQFKPLFGELLKDSISIETSYLVKIIAARSLGEFAYTNIYMAENSFIDDMASHTAFAQIRYNVGDILSVLIYNNDENKFPIFQKMYKWANDTNAWEHRWTAAAAISRMYVHDIQASIQILDIVARISEKKEDYYQLLPFNMILHSLFTIVLNGHLKEVFFLLYEWTKVSGGNRRKSALGDIAREMFLDFVDFGESKHILGEETFIYAEEKKYGSIPNAPQQMRAFMDKETVEDDQSIYQNKCTKSLFWQLIIDDIYCSHESYEFFDICLYFICDAICRNNPKSAFNRYIPNPYRESPSNRMLTIIKDWIILSNNDEYKYLEKPLYYLLAKTYARLPQWAKVARYKSELEKLFHSDNRSIYNVNLLEKVLLAFDHIDNVPKLEEG